MRKKRRLLNPHKLKRRVNRRMTRTSARMNNTAEKARPSSHKHNKDFSWRKRKHNPFTKDDPHYHLKKKIKLAVAISCLVGCAYVIMYHSFFHIDEIEISGAERIPQQEFSESVSSILNYKKFFVLPRNNYFMVNVDEIRDILLEKFPIHTVKVVKQFPNKLTISLEEKVATIIYDNGKEYVKVGTDGYVTEKIRKVFQEEWVEITTTTISVDEEGNETTNTEVLERIHKPDITQLLTEVGEYPIVFDKTSTEEANEQEQQLPENIAINIVTVYERLTNHSNISFRYISLENKQGNAIVHTTQGWDLLMNLSQDPQKQLHTLEHLINNNTLPLNRLTQVNLQYLPQVYWQ